MSDSVSAREIIELLDLKPLEFEGGYYRETYRSQDILKAAHLPERYRTDRAICTAIYYLLTPDTSSKIHRLPTDEIFHFYLGDPVAMLLLYPDGRGGEVTLGPDLVAGQGIQLTVPAGVWQGSRLVEGGRFALMGTTVAPGFDIGDFEAAEYDDLIRNYPEYSAAIDRLR